MRSLVVAVLLIATTAHADNDSDDDASPVTAGLLSAGGTAVAYIGGIKIMDGTVPGTSARDVAFGATAAAWIALPSLGHWYAHDWLSTGFVIRAISVGAVALAAQDNSCEDEPCASSFLILGGVIGLVTGTVMDIATAPNAAHDYNAHRHLTIAPTVLMPPSGPVIGVGVTLKL
jgi:hypothetical protein